MRAPIMGYFDRITSLSYMWPSFWKLVGAQAPRELEACARCTYRVAAFRIASSLHCVFIFLPRNERFGSHCANLPMGNHSEHFAMTVDRKTQVARTYHIHVCVKDVHLRHCPIGSVVNSVSSTTNIRFPCRCGSRKWQCPTRRWASKSAP